MIPTRVWAISDIHIDYQENFDRMLEFARRGHRADALIVAGDATDRLDRLGELFRELVSHFRQVLFVPGNHELWVRRSGHEDSLQKLQAIRALCANTGVLMEPVLVGQYQKVWLVPMLSWYDDKDQPAHSLFVEKDYAEDRTDEMWGDFVHARWPQHMTQPLAQFFAAANEPHLAQPFQHPVISFSHFLPRQDLIFHKPVVEALALASKYDPLPEFNFSRVAGSRRIDEQIRRLGSTLHIYGHQHRNRRRHLDGVTYLSHCMGYPKERQRGHVAHEAVEPLCVWRDDTGFVV
ncbi:metallophosphoesterase [Ketobacter sp.]|uniref:metallophosphoesterase n=1 Tax=Ketobacter sp. TaxID=2083498 RepID=UPI0025C1C7E1|nr:metallophosphoesterase [Ketobacter sp.]